MPALARPSDFVQSAVRALPPLTFACYLAWMSLSTAIVDQPSHYAHTLPICLGFLVGVVAGLFYCMRANREITRTMAVGLGVTASVSNGIAMAQPPVLVGTGFLAIASLACGFLLHYWANLFVAIDKGRIASFIATGGLLCSCMLVAPALGEQATALALALCPLLFAVFTRISYRTDARGVALLPDTSAPRADAMASPSTSTCENDISDLHDAPMKDTRHTAWPLPCAILVCAIMSSVFSSLLTYPFIIVPGDAHLYVAEFGIIMCALLVAWTVLARRRNVNPFLIVAMFMLEISLLAFSTGLVNRVYIPIYAITATVYVLSILLWILAAYLSRNARIGTPHYSIFALLVGCGSGFLGHAIGYPLSQGFDLPFASMEILAAVLMASFAVILMVFSSVELIVMRTNLETEHAHVVADVRSHAEREVQTARDEAAEQVSNAKRKAAQQISEIWDEAEQQVETARQEAEQLAEAMKISAATSVTMSMREACIRLGRRYNLTNREIEAVVFICDGMSRAEIASIWKVTQNTVKYHTRNAYAKLHVHNSRELIAFVEESRTDIIPR